MIFGADHYFFCKNDQRPSQYSFAHAAKMITFEQQCGVLITILLFFDIQKNSEHIVFYSGHRMTFFNQLQK